MKHSKTIITVITVIKILIIAIIVAVVICLITMPKWKGAFFAGAGALLIINLLIAMLFLSKNIKK